LGSHPVAIQNAEMLRNSSKQAGLCQEIWLLGAPTTQGRTPVLNTFSQCLYEIGRETESDLLPDAELLLDATKGNPWAERLNHRIQ
jgi:hypothetical protein